MGKPRQPVNVYGNYIHAAQMKGDKIIIHKCELDKAIKRVKKSRDPYGDEYCAGREQGYIWILEDLLNMIKRGKKIENEKYKNEKHL